MKKKILLGVFLLFISFFCYAYPGTYFYQIINKHFESNKQEMIDSLTMGEKRHGACITVLLLAKGENNFSLFSYEQILGDSEFVDGDQTLLEWKSVAKITKDEVINYIQNNEIIDLELRNLNKLYLSADSGEFVLKTVDNNYFLLKEKDNEITVREFIQIYEKKQLIDEL